MERVVFFLIVLFFLLVNSCSYNTNFMGQKLHAYVGDHYYADQTLYIKDFIIYSSTVSRDYRLKVESKGDSLFAIFKTGLDQLDLNLRYIEDGRNYAQLSFFTDEHLTYEKINKSLIFKSASQFPDKTIVFPVILNFYKIFQDFDMSSNYYPKLAYYLAVAVIVVKNKKVLYFKQTRHLEFVSQKNHLHKYEDFHFPIPQEKWNSLVLEVMRDYVERLK